jgi:tRNA(fMet)-specific endonuclease VapC
MRYLLDANAVIALLNDSASRLARRVRREKPQDVAISAIVAHELFYGAFKSRRAPQNVALIDALQFAVLEFDREDARQAGELRALLAAKGKPIGPYDVLIAGQAVARNMILVTHNADEFGRVPGLRIDDWQGSA